MTKEDEIEKVTLPKWYEEVQTTDKQYTREVKYGSMKFTAINATYQNMLATKVFGLYGDKWGVYDLNYNEIYHDGKPIILTLDAIFFYTLKDTKVAFPVSSEDMMWTNSTPAKLATDLRKKLLTDVTTKALSKIGFSADVFLGMFDDQKYVDDLEKKGTMVKTKLPTKLKAQMLTAIEKSIVPESIDYALKRLADFNVSATDLKLINKKANDKKALLQKG